MRQCMSAYFKIATYVLDFMRCQQVLPGKLMISGANVKRSFKSVLLNIRASLISSLWPSSQLVVSMVVFILVLYLTRGSKRSLRCVLMYISLEVMPARAGSG